MRTRIRGAGTTEPGILGGVSHLPFSQVPCDAPLTSCQSLHEGPDLSGLPGPAVPEGSLSLTPVPVFGKGLLRAPFLQSSSLRSPLLSPTTLPPPVLVWGLLHAVLLWG